MAPYDCLADEYYSLAHKTSRNFDSATHAALESVRARVPEDGLVLEVGAGRGRCGEFLGISPKRVVQLDNSERMLRLQPREQAVLQVLHDARRLPFTEAQFSCVAAFLADPYLGLEFLFEARRVLRPGGLFVLTNPAFEWAEPLRKELRLSPLETRFLTREGKVVLPSVVVPKPQLKEMAEVAGFQAKHIDLDAHTLPKTGEPISDDIAAVARIRSSEVYAVPVLYSLVAVA